MKRPLRLVLALFAGFALLAAACGSDDDPATGTTAAGGPGTTTAATGEPSGDKPAIVIGAQDFGESAILAEIYKQALEDAGLEVSIQVLGGFRDLELAAFEDGTINFAPEYAASMLEFLNEDVSEATSDAAETTGLLQGYLGELGLVALDPTEGVDTNAFVVTQATSDELGIVSLSDLAEKGADLTLGAPIDCETNPFCLPGLQEVYGLDLSANFQPLESGAIFDALQAGEIDVALLFSTDGRIAAEGLVLLDDDQQMLAADNVLPVVSQEVADAYGAQLTDVTDAVGALITTDALIELNKRYDIDAEDADAIATDFLTEAGILG